VGVEFGGTAVSSSGYAANLTQNAEQSQSLVEDNQELQWTEGYYRGYFQMHLSAGSMEARFFGKLATR
jgi:alkaline phosphatase D